MNTYQVIATVTRSSPSDWRSMSQVPEFFVRAQDAAVAADIARRVIDAHESARVNVSVIQEPGVVFSYTFDCGVRLDPSA